MLGRFFTNYFEPGSDLANLSWKQELTLFCLEITYCRDKYNKQTMEPSLAKLDLANLLWFWATIWRTLCDLAIFWASAKCSFFIVEMNSWANFSTCTSVGRFLSECSPSWSRSSSPAAKTTATTPSGRDRWSRTWCKPWWPASRWY